MREIVPLPEVITLEETPDYVVGVANLRGQIVPIIDLNRRFGHRPQPHRLEDCVVVLEHAGNVVGIIVNEVLNVLEVAPTERLPVPSYGLELPLDSRFLTGLIASGEAIVMLLDLENLLRLAEELADLPGTEEIPPSAPSDVFCPDATAHERAIFQERAMQLAQPLESREQNGAEPLVVVRLGEELFAVGLQAIHEFAVLRNVTAIPCCPDHIVGLMNLRGDLLTVLDIAGSLGVPPLRGRADCKVVVLNRAEWGVGVLVDEVLDVITPDAATTSPSLPDGRASVRASEREYLQGTMPYGAQMLSLLDLPALLMQQNLIVNESP